MDHPRGILLFTFCSFLGILPFVFAYFAGFGSFPLVFAGFVFQQDPFGYLWLPEPAPESPLRDYFWGSGKFQPRSRTFSAPEKWSYRRPALDPKIVGS